MNARACCREATGWAAPTLGLALLPKCPMCVAAYVAAITGAGISVSMAARLRLGLLTLCLVALACLAIRLGTRMLNRHPRATPRVQSSSSSDAPPPSPARP